MPKYIPWDAIMEKHARPGEARSELLARKLNELGTMDAVADVFGISRAAVHNTMREDGVVIYREYRLNGRRVTRKEAEAERRAGRVS